MMEGRVSRLRVGTGLGPAAAARSGIVRSSSFPRRHDTKDLTLHATRKENNIARVNYDTTYRWFTYYMFSWLSQPHSSQDTFEMFISTGSLKDVLVDPSTDTSSSTHASSRRVSSAKDTLLASGAWLAVRLKVNHYSSIIMPSETPSQSLNTSDSLTITDSIDDL
ncbi:hypothetical protein BJV78DRAFT_1219579, partial [Lactifluus subvellereus]